MKYFLRNFETDAITGPFEAEEIRRRVTAGEVRANVLAAPTGPDDSLPPDGSSATAWKPVESVLSLSKEQPAPPVCSGSKAIFAQVQRNAEGMQFCPSCAHKLAMPLSSGELGTCERCGKAITGECSRKALSPATPPPAAPAIVVLAPHADTNEIRFCSGCAHPLTKPLTSGETGVCEHCGRTLSSAPPPTVQAPSMIEKKPSGVARGFLTAIGGILLFLLGTIISAVILLFLLAGLLLSNCRH